MKKKILSEKGKNNKMFQTVYFKAVNVFIFQDYFLQVKMFFGSERH